MHVHTPNTANNPATFNMPDDGDNEDAASIASIEDLMDKCFRMLDRISGGTVSGFVTYSSSAATDYLSGASLTSEAGAIVLLTGTALVPISLGYVLVSNDVLNNGTLRQNGNATFGAAAIVDIGGNGIIRKSIACTSAGRIKSRVTFLAGTGNTNDNAVNFDEFIYEGLTGTRTFVLSGTGAEDGDEVTISLVPLGPNANTVHVQDQAFNLLLDLKNGAGLPVWGDFKYSAHAPAGWRCLRYGLSV